MNLALRILHHAGRTIGVDQRVRPGSIIRQREIPGERSRAAERPLPDDATVRKLTDSHTGHLGHAYRIEIGQYDDGDLDLAVLFGGRDDGGYPRSVVEPAQSLLHARIAYQQIGVDHRTDDMFHIGQVAAPVLAHVDDYALDIWLIENHSLVVAERLCYGSFRVLIEYPRETESCEKDIGDVVDSVRYDSHVVVIAFDIVDSQLVILDASGYSIGIYGSHEIFTYHPTMGIIARSGVDISGRDGECMFRTFVKCDAEMMVNQIPADFREKLLHRGEKLRSFVAVEVVGNPFEHFIHLLEAGQVFVVDPIPVGRIQIPETVRIVHTVPERREHLRRILHKLGVVGVHQFRSLLAAGGQGGRQGKQQCE